MEYQSVAIIKDENDSSQMFILNIEKLAETIVIKGNGTEDCNIKDFLKSTIKETLSDILIDLFHTDNSKPVIVNINTLVSGIVSI
jgi:hypothetical protein